MEAIEHIDEKGRKYKAYKQGDLPPLIVGPAEGLVDELELPEPFATNLHNALYRRKVFTYGDVQRKQSQLLGALQETLSIDVQKLTEVFFRFSEEVPQ